MNALPRCREQKGEGKETESVAKKSASTETEAEAARLLPVKEEAAATEVAATEAASRGAGGWSKLRSLRSFMIDRVEVITGKDLDGDGDVGEAGSKQEGGRELAKAEGQEVAEKEGAGPLEDLEQELSKLDQDLSEAKIKCEKKRQEVKKLDKEIAEVEEEKNKRDNELMSAIKRMEKKLDQIQDDLSKLSLQAPGTMHMPYTHMYWS